MFPFITRIFMGGRFIWLGIILAIFPQIATPLADWNDVYDASNEGPGCPNLDRTNFKFEDCLRLNVYTGKVMFLLSSYLNYYILIKQDIYTRNYKLLFFNIIVFIISI